ncbi:MAG TPA: WbqC family protein, partial [Candidatus Nitrosotalea sp.]|nr:WbqC family protein [Candidatus Nitrosotalea sp.]
MKVTIHQPQYFPYPGFFHKLCLSDVFVIMDDAQYDKRFTNRNKIMATNGWTWLSVPINKDHKFLPNSQVEINNEISWRDEHWKKIYHSYANAIYFKKYETFFKSVYENKWTSLFELNFETLRKVIDLLGIKTSILKSSELNVSGTSTQRLVNLCKAVGADTYVSGIGGKDYMDEKLFSKNNLKLEYQNYAAKPYPQRLSDTFVPDLSIIDMLVNVGPQSIKIISESDVSLAP